MYCACVISWVEHAKMQNTVNTQDFSCCCSAPIHTEHYSPDENNNINQTIKTQLERDMNSIKCNAIRFYRCMRALYKHVNWVVILSGFGVIFFFFKLNSLYDTTPSHILSSLFPLCLFASSFSISMHSISCGFTSCMCYDNSSSLSFYCPAVSV